MLTIYHNPRCSKSRDALKLIEDSGSMVEVVEYLKTPPAKDDLRQIIERLGIKPIDLVRKNEPIYKEKYKGKELTDEEWIDAMEEHPILIERPIVLKDGKAILGRPPENVKEFLV
ncbi:MAG: arsenate reductase (glutaredoxin) [Fulvivirga sp.]